MYFKKFIIYLNVLFLCFSLYYCDDNIDEVITSERNKDLEILNQQEKEIGSWILIKNTGIALAGAASAEHNGWLYIHGGENSLGTANDFWRVELSTGTIESLGTDLARSRHGTAVIGDIMYLFGGIDENGDAVNTLMTYDLSNIDGVNWKTELDVSDTNGPFPSARYGHQVLAYDGALYIFGGADDAGNTDNILHRLSNFSEPRPDWENINNDGPGLAGFGAAAGNGSLYVYGGFESFGISSTIMYSDSMWRYDFAADDWTETPFPVTMAPRAWMQFAVVGNDGYTFWGSNGTEVFEDSWSFNTAEQWFKISAEPEPRAVYTMVPVPNGMVLYGGYNSTDDVYFSDLWMLQLN